MQVDWARETFTPTGPTLERVPLPDGATAALEPLEKTASEWIDRPTYQKI